MVARLRCVFLVINIDDFGVARPIIFNERLGWGCVEFEGAVLELSECDSSLEDCSAPVVGMALSALCVFDESDDEEHPLSIVVAAITMNTDAAAPR